MQLLKSRLAKLCSTLEPFSFHFLFTQLPKMAEMAHPCLGGDHQVLLILWLLGHCVPGQNQGLAEPTENQQIERVSFCLIKRKNAFPSRHHWPSNVYRIGILNHHVHDGDGQLKYEIPTAHVSKIKDPRDLVLCRSIGFHQEVVVVKVSMVNACNAIKMFLKRTH